MGGATIFCHSALMEKEHLDVSCPSGLVLHSKPAIFGLISTQHEQKSFCHQKSLDEDLGKHGHTNCSSSLNYGELKSRFKTTCGGKESCEFNLKGIVYPGDTTSENGVCGKDAYLFVQAPCLVPKEKMGQRQIAGLTVGCIGVFIYLFMLVYIDFIKSVQTTKYVDWDVKTITAGDYTVEFDIKKSLYYRFLEQFHDPSNPIPEITQFKLFIQNELEERLTAMPALGLDGPEGDEAPVKIAVLTFAFDNSKVIKWLRQRGTCIKNE